MHSFLILVISVRYAKSKLQIILFLSKNKAIPKISAQSGNSSTMQTRVKFLHKVVILEMIQNLIGLLFHIKSQHNIEQLSSETYRGKMKQLCNKHTNSTSICIVCFSITNNQTQEVRLHNTLSFNPLKLKPNLIVIEE